jgi:hypothetical protein
MWFRPVDVSTIAARAPVAAEREFLLERVGRLRTLIAAESIGSTEIFQLEIERRIGADAGLSHRGVSGVCALTRGCDARIVAERPPHRFGAGHDLFRKRGSAGVKDDPCKDRRQD